MNDIPRIKTYISGFDEKMDGGIEEGHVILLSGTPGSMKSSIALNMLYNNYKHEGKKGLYISIEESKDSLMATMKNVGLGDVDENMLYIVDIGRLRLDNYGAEDAKDWFKILREYLSRRIEEDKIDIVVIDSLTAIYSLTDLINPRQQLFHFFGFLKNLNVTSILISEMASNDETYGPFREDFLADGSILLKFQDVGEVELQLRIRLVKMRHSNIYHGWQALLYRNGKFMVTAPISE